MPIVTSKPLELAHPDIPYSKLGVSLSVSPVWHENDVEAAVSITAVPYRILPDGSIDKRPDLTWGFSTGQAFADAQTDPDLAAAAGGLMALIQQFVAAKGV